VNANELADNLNDGDVSYITMDKAATMLRQQQAEIEELKNRCLDEIFKTTYADQTAKVMEQYWQEAQAEIAILRKAQEK